MSSVRFDAARLDQAGPLPKLRQDWPALDRLVCEICPGLDGVVRMSAPKKNAPTVPPVEARQDQTFEGNPKTSQSAVYRKVVSIGSRAAVIQAQRNRDNLAKVRAPLTPTPPWLAMFLMSLTLEEQPGNDTKTQAARILTALEHGPVTTQEMRVHLDVVHPCGRVMELRDMGHQIDKHWVRQITTAGKTHRFARYILMHREVA